jgi:hypothetical protein
VVDINLHQPGHIDVVIPFPTEWNELELPELHSISKAMLGSYDIPSAMRGAILKEMIAYRWKISGQPMVSEWQNKLDAENIVVDGYPLIDFLFTENSLTRQPYPKLKLPFSIRHSPFTTLHGPEEEFNSITCGEYEDTEIFYHQFRQQPSGEPLAHIASILWRKKGVPYISYDYKSGKYRSYDSEKIFPLFMKLPPWILYTIFIWYTGCREMLPKIFRNVCDGGEENAQPDMLAFTKCIHSGAGEKNGSRNQIRMMLLKEFFLDMDLEAKKVKELNQKK